MDESLADNQSLVNRVQQLERERNELRRDIEQLCMQQAGPAYLGVATRMHFQRTTLLEQDIENLKKQLATCTRENQNLNEELSEAYRIKSQLADLHSAEVLKNVEAEKQLKFFQGCVAAAFAERDNAIMEAEKAKEKEERMPQELEKSQRRVEELTAEFLREKEQTTSLHVDLEKHETQNEMFKEVIDKFYHIRQVSLENSTDASWEEKCESLLNDSDEIWRFQNEEDTSTSHYINSLEAEIENLRRSVDGLQNKLRVGLEIESHLKKKVRSLDRKNIRSERKIRKQISALLQHHSQYRIDIVNLLDEGYSEIKSLNDAVVEKMRQLDTSTECNLKSSQNQVTELHESECKDVHISADLHPFSLTQSNDPSLTKQTAPETGDYSEALAQALHEKVAALLLMSQQEERHLLERNVNAALQKKVEELQRNLMQVTNEKVKALMELAQLKQQRYTMQEKVALDNVRGKSSGETSTPEKEGKLKNLLKKGYLNRWVGISDASNPVDAHQSPHKDFARIKIENATLKESLESMEHLLLSVRRLRISLVKAKMSSSEEIENTSWFDSIEQIIAEANLIKTAVGSSLPTSWSAESDRSGEDSKVDFVSAAGFEMMELLVFAAQVLKDLMSDKWNLNPAPEALVVPTNLSAENMSQ